MIDQETRRKMRIIGVFSNICRRQERRMGCRPRFNALLLSCIRNMIRNYRLIWNCYRPMYICLICYSCIAKLVCSG